MTTQYSKTKYSSLRRLTSSLLLVLCLSIPVGCQSMLKRGGGPFSMFAKKPPAVFSTASTKKDIVEHLNNQIVQVSSWRSTDARLKATGIPVPLSAMIAVEKPNNFRLVVSNGLTGSQELDLGSNSNQFWTWARQMEPKNILTVRHENMGAIQKQMPFPVQPEWLMEVFGLTEFDMNKVDLVFPDPEKPEARLISDYRTKEGVQVRKVSIIDMQQGVVTGHRLYDIRGDMVASAELGQFRPTPVAGIELPQKIKLQWAKPKLSMNLTFPSLEVNVPELDDHLWNVPTIAGYPVREIDHELIRMAERKQKQQLVRSKNPRQEYLLNPKTGQWDEHATINKSKSAGYQKMSPFADASSTTIDEKISPFSIQKTSGTQKKSPFESTPFPEEPVYQPTTNVVTPKTVRPEALATKTQTAQTPIVSNPGVATLKNPLTDAPRFQSTAKATTPVKQKTEFVENQGWSFNPGANIAQTSTAPTPSPVVEHKSFDTSGAPEWANSGNDATKTFKPVETPQVPVAKNSEKPFNPIPEYNKPVVIQPRQVVSQNPDVIPNPIVKETPKPKYEPIIIPRRAPIEAPTQKVLNTEPIANIPAGEKPVLLVSTARAAKIRQEKKANDLGQDPWSEEKVAEKSIPGRSRIKALTASFSRPFSKKPEEKSTTPTAKPPEEYSSKASPESSDQPPQEQALWRKLLRRPRQN